MDCSWLWPPLVRRMPSSHQVQGSLTSRLPFLPHTQSQVPCREARLTVPLPEMPFLLGGNTLVSWQDLQVGRCPGNKPHPSFRTFSSCSDWPPPQLTRGPPPPPPPPPPPRDPPPPPPPSPPPLPPLPERGGRWAANHQGL